MSRIIEKLQSITSSGRGKNAAAEIAAGTFYPDDWAGGNIDDAFGLGCDVGEYQLAVELLKIIEKSA